MGCLGLGARAPAGAQSLGRGCGGTKRRARICDHDHGLKITPRPPPQGGGGRSEDFQSGCSSLSIKRGPSPCPLSPVSLVNTRLSLSEDSPPASHLAHPHVSQRRGPQGSTGAGHPMPADFCSVEEQPPHPACATEVQPSSAHH